MCVAAAILLATIGGCAAAAAAPLPVDTPVRGWTIVSASEPEALATIAAARAYDINRLELSHELVSDLRQLKDDARCALVNRLTETAHAAGIAEVVLWDHALYPLEYYPERFRTGPGGTIDLDNPGFWAWFKADYRSMLDRVPYADGIVLTFIETGARAELQHSINLKTPQHKLAAVVNAVADVVIGERKLNLYARTFSYSHAEYANIIGAVEHFDRPEIRLMMKETPHDFFLTHPNNRYAGTIARPTLIEFDIAGEYHGQSVIAATWPEYVLRRWRDFSRRPNIIGYTARLDRYGDTNIIGRPSEINLLALKRAVEDTQVTAEQIYDQFISSRYGTAAVPGVKAAFKNAFGIVCATMYTLGTNITHHSWLNYDSSVASYVRHVSGNWIEPPIVWVGHGVNREFHYWRDVVDHLAPAYMKAPAAAQWAEVPWVRENGWIHAEERMDEDYLRCIVTEKSHGVALAEDSVRKIEGAREALTPAAYDELHHYFERTLLTACLHRAAASAYFGFRVWCRGETFRTAFVSDTVQAGLAEIRQVTVLIRQYPVKPPAGKWRWTGDADIAETYFDWIVREGWPRDDGVADAVMRKLPNPARPRATDFSPNPNAGMRFPFVTP